MTEEIRRFAKLYAIIEYDGYLTDDRNGNETLIRFLYNVEDINEIEKIAYSKEWTTLYRDVITAFVWNYLITKGYNDNLVNLIADPIIEDFEGLLIHTGAELKEQIEDYYIAMIEE